MILYERKSKVFQVEVLEDADALLYNIFHSKVIAYHDTFAGVLVALAENFHHQAS